MERLGKGMAISLVAYADRLASHLAISAPNTLVLGVPEGYNLLAERCDTPEGRSKMEHALTTLLRRAVVVRFERTGSAADSADSAAEANAGRRRDESAVDDDPMVRKVVELFEARRLHLDYDEPSRPPSG